MPKPSIYFIRHGETDWNAIGRLQGRCDIPLNEKGRAQAAGSGTLLQNLMARERREPASFAYVSSPMVRALATMEIVRPILGLPVAGYTLDERLKEIAYGEWEGMTIPETQARDPDVFAMRERDKWNTAAPSGENYAAVERRVATWYDEVSSDTVVTAHGGTLRVLMAMMGLMPQNEAASMQVGQGVIYAFVDGAVKRYG